MRTHRATTFDTARRNGRRGAGSRRTRYIVACLAGGGIGPELTAEASRALRAVSRMHGFTIEDIHPPFGGEAIVRYGHPLPTVTRDAYRAADAVLVALTRDPAVEGVKADLDLTCRIQRVRIPSGGDLAIVSPLVPEGEAEAIERAFDLARARRARLALVSQNDRFGSRVDRAARAREGVLYERVPPARALPQLAHEPERFCVVLTHQPLTDPISDVAAFGSNGSRVVASGQLSDHGPGIFGPTHGSAPDIAGQGIANPSGILLAAALMLGEGLGERGAARTLERAVTEAIVSGVRTPDLPGARAAVTTRNFSDAVLGLLQSTRTDVEFHAGYAS